MENNVILIDLQDKDNTNFLQDILIRTNFTDREYLKKYMLVHSNLIYQILIVLSPSVIIEETFFTYDNKNGALDHKVFFFKDCYDAEGNLLDMFNRIGFLHLVYPNKAMMFPETEEENKIDDQYRDQIVKNNPCNPDDDFICIKCKDIIDWQNEVHNSIKWIYAKDTPSGINFSEFGDQLSKYRYNATYGLFKTENRETELIKLIRTFEKLEESSNFVYNHIHFF